MYLLQIQLSFYISHSGTEVNGKTDRIRKELGVQDLVLMWKLNHFLPSATVQKCGLSEQRLKGRGRLLEVIGSRYVFDGKGKSCALHLKLCPTFKLPACDYKVTVFYPYNILNDYLGKFTRMAEVNHKALAMVNRLQESAGVLKLLCKDLCCEALSGYVPRLVGILVHLDFYSINQAMGNPKGIYKG